MRFHDEKVEREIFFNPELATAEAYMDGRLTIENAGIYDLLLLFSVNRRRASAPTRCSRCCARSGARCAGFHQRMRSAARRAMCASTTIIRPTSIRCGSMSA